MQHKAFWLIGGFVVALLLGFNANPAPQPQRVSDLVARLDTLEEENRTQQDALDALDERMAALEEAIEHGVAGPDQPVILAEEPIVPEDWDEAVTTDGILLYHFDPSWELTSAEPGTMDLWLDENTALFFAWDWSSALIDDLRDDEEFYELFEKDLFGSDEMVTMGLLDSGTIEFLGDEAFYWDINSVSADGFASRNLSIFYACGERESCSVSFVRFDPDPTSNGDFGDEFSERDWAFVQTFASGIEFLTIGKSIVVANANLRSCPSTECEILGRLVRGEIVDVVAQSEDGLWFQLESGEWLNSGLVDGAPLDLPVMRDEGDI
jgi:hypothetical protein